MDPLTNDIHPIVAKSNFSSDFDYDGAMMPSLRLFTNILLSPQSLHYYYAVYYGKNMATRLPPAFEGRQADTFPHGFACNKGILELTPRDRAAVHKQLLHLAKHVKFYIHDLSPDRYGECRSIRSEQGEKLRGSTIVFSKTMYDRLLDKNKTLRQLKVVQFHTSLIFLHELAHAAQALVCFPRRAEDFFEDSLIAEAGWEYKSRIFGLCPYFRYDAEEGEDGERWATWQEVNISSMYDMDERCRARERLPKHRFFLSVDFDFIASLFTDHFWQITMLRGPQALVADNVATMLMKASGRWIRLTLLPMSIVDLYRGAHLSYAARMYRRARNPHLVLRTGLLEEGNKQLQDQTQSGGDDDDPDR